MDYVYDIPNKESGLLIPAIITQKNGRDYKLMSAQDIAWNVTLNDKDNTVLNSTNDLLDYITATKNGVLTVEADTVYRIECPITVCQEGTVFTQSPEINIYKVRGGDKVLMSALDLTQASILIEMSAPDDGQSIIKYDKDNRCLDGTARFGVYTMTLKRDAIVLATYSLFVTKSGIKSIQYTVYRQSDALPSAPTGGTYDFSTNTFVSPINWVEDINALDTSKTIWWSIGTIYSDASQSTSWSTPCIYLSDTSIDSSRYQSDTIALYQAVYYGGDAPDAPSTEDGGMSYNPISFLEPLGWYRSMQDAIDAFRSEAYENSKNMYDVYVTYNTYSAKVSDDNVYSDYTLTGWTDPQKFFNIRYILSDAEQKARDIADTAVDNAISNIGDVSNLVSDITVVKDTVNSIYEWVFYPTSDQIPPRCIEITESDPQYQYFSEYIDLHGLIVISGGLDVLNQNQSLCTLDFQNRYVWTEGIIIDDENRIGYLAYTCSTTQLRSQVTKTSAELKEISQTVNELTPDYIRLLVSKANLKDVTWTRVSETEWNANTSIQHSGTTLPSTGYIYGHYYSDREIVSGVIHRRYYRCDYPITTGFLNILADNVSLGVAKTVSGNTISSTITCKIDDNNVPVTNIVSDEVRITGSLIAAAISAESANINNTTYLQSNGDVLFAQGEGKSGSAFYNDGHGYLAGSNIEWDKNGNLSVNGEIIANSGRIGGENGWNIGTVSADSTTIPAMYAVDTLGNGLYMTTQYLASKNGDSFNWFLLSDGDASFANGHAVFNKNGSAVIGNETTNITLSPSGDLTLTGVSVAISSDQVTLIGTNVKNLITSDEEFKGIITSSIGTSIIGQLNTLDVSVGNGACFFDGTGEDAGAGHVANGAIRWDKNGKLILSGNVDIQSVTSQYGADVWTKDYVLSKWTNGIKQEDLSALRPIYLPDPSEYIGRSVMLSIHIDSETMKDIATSCDSVGFGKDILDYTDYYNIHGVCPVIKIVDNAKSHWIKWGCYADETFRVRFDKEVNEQLSTNGPREPKFYYIGHLSRTVGVPGFDNGSQFTVGNQKAAISPTTYNNGSTNEPVGGICWYDSDNDFQDGPCEISLMLSLPVLEQIREMVVSLHQPTMTLNVKLSARTQNNVAYWLVETSDFMPVPSVKIEKGSYGDYYYKGFDYALRRGEGYEAFGNTFGSIENFYKHIEFPLKKYIGFSNIFQENLN